ncbi:response regulator [Lignipirellula cremea]|uniref:Translational regulator CsrA n=1 Tax=Lignipirellula cremea TaxID=2528010 RepID=A0A518DQZ9_9BACT|nr:response regulator [Lignipirellula cremea]QDU94263.1 CAI-1 autoinducer sensor kinase/phosphatase CqsS [Lignipirellula cremea]
MLVLSRRVQETIVLPTIDTTLEILSVKGNVARVGIQAPKKLPVLRGELIDPTVQYNDDLDPSGQRKQVHQLRNALNLASMGIGLADRQLDIGQNREARATLKTVLREVNAMCQVASTPATVEKRPACRMLLVEDDANERRLLAGFLRLSGIEVAIAKDGVEAINYLASNKDKPQIVLMDMLMPNCDGPTAVRAIRNTPEHAGIKIYGVSGAPAESFPLKTPGDVDGWFRKPLDPERLVGEIARMVETSAA